ncbi:MAG: Cu(I)-responsive transcriptional regulator [Pseudomonadota bacterium]
MNIGEVSERTGLPAKTIRYYEDIDLITPKRASNGYRVYEDADLHQLAFVQRSRSFGFSIEECRLLLSLYEDDARSSADVKAIALSKIGEIDRKLSELKSLKTTLLALAKNCHGDDKPNCPIIDDLAGLKSA